MNNKDILFQIKNLHKSIVKAMMKNKNIKEYPSPTQIMIINYMIDNKNEDIYQKDIEIYLGLSRATVSEVLYTMEKNNIIKRQIDSNDTRTKKVFLNELAFDKRKEAFEQVKKINTIITNNILEEDMNVFVRVLNQIQNNLDNTMDL